MDRRWPRPRRPNLAPTVVAALSADKAEQAQPTIVAEPAPAATAPPATEAAARPAPIAIGTDTLKAEDKAIEAVAPAKVACSGRDGADQGEPLPLKDVKIPNPRIDPAVIEARRKQILAQQQARARAVKARRIAAARARAAAQARAAAAAANPFGAPANSTTNNSIPNPTARTSRRRAQCRRQGRLTQDRSRPPGRRAAPTPSTSRHRARGSRRPSR